MNRKQLLLLLGILAVVGAACLVLLNRNKESWSTPEARMGDKVLPNFQPNQVAAIHIKGIFDLTVVHTNELWRVRERQDYPANFRQISALLLKLKELKVIEAETISASQLDRVDLDQPGRGDSGGTLVEFKDAHGTVLDSLLLGKKHVPERSSSPFGNSADGRYLLLPSHPQDVLLISDALSGFQPNPEQWLDKDFFKVEKIKSIALQSTNAADSWKLARETEKSPWVLLDRKTDEVLDTNMANSMANRLGYPSFIDVRSDTEADLIDPAVVTIQTFDHFTYTLKIGRKSAAGDYELRVTVRAEIPNERIASRDETTAEKVRLDQEFQDRAKGLREKLGKEQALAPWTYQVGSWVTPMLHDRVQILAGNRTMQPFHAEKKTTRATSSE